MLIEQVGRVRQIHARSSPAAEYFLAFSSDGIYVVTCTGTESILLRRTADGAPICEYYPRGAFNQFDFAPGGEKLAVGTMHGEVHLLCLEGKATERGGAGGRTTKARVSSGSGPRSSSGGAPGRTQVRPAPGIGRNDPCPCGSGKKYGKCHGA
jgi:hypothetical protein